MSVSVTLPDHKRGFHSYGLFWQNVCVSVKLQQIRRTCCNDIKEIRKKSCFLSISLFRPDLNHFRRKDCQLPQIVYIHCDIHI